MSRLRHNHGVFSTTGQDRVVLPFARLILAVVVTSSTGSCQGVRVPPVLTSRPLDVPELCFTLERVYAERAALAQAFETALAGRGLEAAREAIGIRGDLDKLLDELRSSSEASSIDSDLRRAVIAAADLMVSETKILDKGQGAPPNLHWLRNDGLAILEASDTTLRLGTGEGSTVAASCIGMKFIIPEVSLARPRP